MSHKSFADLGLSQPVVRALAENGMQSPFAIQALVIEDVLEGVDVLAKSPTGSGKTIAFVAPMVDVLDPAARKPSALVLAPTRELVSQIVEEARPLAEAKGLKVASVYGGVGFDKQIRNAKRGPPRGGHARAGSRTCCTAARSRSPASRSSSSTRPTGCSTWASARPSTGSSPSARPTARRCSSARRSTARPAASRASTRPTR